MLMDVGAHRLAVVDAGLAGDDQQADLRALDIGQTIDHRLRRIDREADRILERQGETLPAHQQILETALVEADALAAVFAEVPGILVNAAKGLLGHALNTAGLVETVAVLIQMRDGFVHPNVGLVDPVRPLSYAGPKAVRRPVRRAMKTAFGFGGFNAAVILEAS